MTDKVTRTFDILDRLMSNFQREDALGGKQGDEWYTYSTKEYVENSNLVARAMYELGLNPGDKVATITANCPEWNFFDMGLAMAGIIHVPIYPTISDEEYNYILNHAEVKLIIAGDKKLSERLSVFMHEIEAVKDIYSFDNVAGFKNIDELIEIGRKASAATVDRVEQIKNNICPNEIVTLIYTSGTTGNPKGVMLTHTNLVSNFKAHSDVHSLGIEHRALSFLPLCHVYERSMNYHFQYNGMGVYYVSNLSQIVNAIREVQPHMFNCVPRLLERIYDGFLTKGKDLKGIKRKIYFYAINLTKHFQFNKKYNPIKKIQFAIADKLVYSKWREALGGNVKLIVSGGAALQPKIAQVMSAAKLMVMEGYGLTETSPVIAVNNPKTKKMMIGTVGPILPGIEIKIADDGEILTRGPHVMKGYYKAPELTKEVIDEDGWFHTGDVGILINNAYLKITDRKKEIFKMSGGKYIAPQMIENKLKESFFIEQVMVIGENEKFASAIISPNYDFLHDWSSQRKIKYYNNAELIEHPEVIACINQEVRETNKTLGQHEEIKRVRLVVDTWSSQTGELSPTLKLRRKYVAEKYKNIIYEIYNQNAKEENDDKSLLSNALPNFSMRFDMRTLKRMKPFKFLKKK